VAGPESCPSREHLANPDLTRSAISDLSNCEIAPIIWNMRSPIGSEVSTASVTETKSIPGAPPSSKTRDQRGEGTSERVKFPDDRDINNCFPSTISQSLIQRRSARFRPEDSFVPADLLQSPAATLDVLS
jgi:hypothetical protein